MFPEARLNDFDSTLEVDLSYVQYKTDRLDNSPSFKKRACNPNGVLFTPLVESCWQASYAEAMTQRFGFSATLTGSSRVTFSTISVLLHRDHITCGAGFVILVAAWQLWFCPPAKGTVQGNITNLTPWVT